MHYTFYLEDESTCKKSQRFVLLTFMHHTDVITHDLAMTKMLKPYRSILILSSTSASSRDCSCADADSDAFVLMSLQVFLSTIVKEDRDK